MTHFLNRKSDGTFSYIFYDSKNASLSIKRYGKRGTKGNITILRQNIERDFSCSVDATGTIHIIFSTVNNEIHYGYFTENSFKSFQILSAKSQMNYKKHLMLCAKANPICVFYTIKHNGKNILSMQNVNPEEHSASAPTAIDYILDPDAQINICTNEMGNIFAAYSKDGKENETCINIVREFQRDGTTKNVREYLSEVNEPLSIDCMYFENNETLKLMAHTLSHEELHLLTFDSKISSEKISLKDLPRNANTFYHLLPLYGKLYCYMHSDGNIYSCILRGGSANINLEKQARQYGGNIFPINCIINDLPQNTNQFILPGNLNSGIFFYMFNPFSDVKTTEEVMDFSRLSNIERRLSEIEKYIKDLTK